MANLFEKPIAANPMSQFVGLPLQFINQALQQKQQRYNTAKADIQVVEDSLLKTNALSKDKARQKAILAGFDEQLTAISETGDLSGVQGSLDNLKHQIKREMNGGELGSINANYVSATKDLEERKKLYTTNKISNAGKILGDRAMAEFQTTQKDDGSWTPFSGYTASNLVNPMDALKDSVKSINAKYDDLGQAFIGNDDVKTNLQAELNQNPEVMRSMKEQFLANYSGSTPQKDFKEFYNAAITSVIKDIAYKKKLKLSEGGKKTIRGREWGEVTLPNSRGNFTGEGMSASFLRGLASKYGATDTFNKWVASPEGKEEIKYMEAKSGTTLPDDYSERVAWIEDNLDKKQKGKLISITMPDTMVRDVLSDKGERLTAGAVRNRNWDLMNQDQQSNIFGSDKEGRKAHVGGMVGENSAYPYGSIIIEGRDGQTYIQENLDTEILGSGKFAKSLLNSARRTNTGKKTLTFDRPILYPDGSVSIPEGTYEAKHNIKNDNVVLYFNGKPKIIYGKNSDGVNVMVPYTEK